MKCSNCGKEIKEDALFCNFCGTKVDIPTTDYEEIDDTSMNKDSEIHINELENSSNIDVTEKIVSVDKIEENDYIDENDSVTSNKKKTLIISGICLAVITVIIFIIYAVVSSSTSEMKKALESRDAYQVNAVYNDAYDKPSKLEKYDNLIGNLLNEIYNVLTTYDFYEEAKTSGYTTPKNYITSNYGNLIVDENEDGINIYSSISQRNISTWNDINSLIDCLEHYCAAVCMYENPDTYDNAYKNAISELNESLKTGLYDSKTNELVINCANKYIEITLADVDELIKSEKVSEAASILESAKDYLNENGITSEELHNRINETLASYAQKYYDKAETYFNKKDVDNAIKNIQFSIQLQPENVTYSDKETFYKEFLPFYMFGKDATKSFDDTDEAYTWRTIDFYPKESIEAANGKLYSGCINYRYYSGAKEGIVKYVLNEKYDTISGVFFSPKANVSMNRTGSAYFVVYGDGKEIYKSKTISANSTPIDFSFSVTGVNNLEINFIGENSSVWGADAYSFGDYATIAELTAQKDFPNDKGE